VSDTCPACAGRWPEAAQRVADCGVAVAYLHDDQFYPGWTVLVLKRHATELYQLDADERRRMIEAVSTVARAVADAVGAAKMNYALLGNQLPHIHWHLIPRLPDDPHARATPWSHEHVPVRLEATARDAQIARIRARLTV
jgi:diadenosine tetraphosphate (Ap4A) HIT family hydrolase